MNAAASADAVARDLSDVTTFVGRDDELAEVVRLFGAARLVTITGSPGMGKTRLVLEAAEVLTERFPDGVHLVELATVDDPAQVADAVASSLGAVEAAGTDRTLAVVDVLRHRRSLLIFDTCEHVAEACAALAGLLLEQAPDVAVLATSQRPLEAAGEQVWRIPPLAVPGPDEAPEPSALGRYPAVELFVDRASRQDPAFALTADTAPAVAEICRRLDGVPLAIELAAGQLDQLSAQAIAARLHERLELLDRATLTTKSRHDTLQAALDWSHALLSDEERALLRRLAVFVGGSEVPVAQEVCVDGEVRRERFFALLRGLVARSLVVAESVGGHPRCCLLATTRRYALDRLVEAGEADRFRARHAAWCRELARRAEPELADGDQQLWLQRLDAEHDNLRAALEWASSHPDEAPWWPELCASLALFWSMRGHLREGLHWLGAAMEVDGISAVTRGRLAWGASLLAQGQDNPAAERWALEALTLAQQIGDARLATRAMTVLGASDAYLHGEQRQAVDVLAWAADTARHVGDSWAEIRALVTLGYVALIGNEPAEARRRFEGCLSVAQRHPRSVGHRMHALTGLGRAAMAQGDHELAEASLREALKLARRAGLPFAGATALHHLGRLAADRGETDRARELLLEALEVDRSIGATAAMSHSLGVLGRLDRLEGDVEAAAPRLEQARELALADGTMQPWESRLLAELGAIARLRRDHPAARALLHEALALGEEADDTGATAGALEELGRLASAEGDLTGAAWWQRRALRLYGELGRPPGLVGALEALAGLAGDQGRAQQAAQLFGAAAALREELGYARPPVDRPAYEHDVEATRSALGLQLFERAWQQGAMWSVDTAVDEAERVGASDRPEHGWASLTDRERDVARLAARGLTNREVGERLYVSARTVQSHLSRVYAKLGISSRSELAGN